MFQDQIVETLNLVFPKVQMTHFRDLYPEPWGQMAWGEEILPFTTQV